MQKYGNGQSGRRSTGWIRRLFSCVVLAVMVMICPVNTQASGVKIKGIDVSRWQGSIDWAKVKEDGIEFAMIGIGRYRNGVGTPDTQLKANLENAIAQGIHVGVYLYSEAVTVEEAKQEAAFVLDQIDGYKISYPVAFDIEDTVHTKLTTKERTDITIAFLDVIEEAGYYPMIYASQSWFYDRMDLGRLNKYDKWVARWADTIEFSPVSIWQYSATGRVKGIIGDVDLDYSFKDYSKIITPRTTALKKPQKTGWQTDGKNYWYINEDGTQPKYCLKEIDGNTYFFNKKGYRVTGWKKYKGEYYYFIKSTGVMKKGWMSLSSTKKYYLDPKTGVRRTGFVKVSGKVFYLNKQGLVQRNSWIQENGSWYYTNKSGRIVKGWLTKGKNKYYLRQKDGKRYGGWLTYEGQKYYFVKRNGIMKTGWLNLKGKRYYFGDDGVLDYGWKKIEGKWYFFNKKTGVMAKDTKIGKYIINKKGVCTNRR